MVKKFSNVIKMEFGFNKYQTIAIVKGRLQEGGFEIQNIAAVEAKYTYKYLGMNRRNE